MESTKTHTVLRHFFQRIPRVVIISGVVLLVVLISTILFLVIKKPATFAYGGGTCVQQLTVAPTLMKQAHASPFAVVYGEAITVLGVPIVSLSVCFQAVASPEPGVTTVALSPYGWPVGTKQFAITVPEAPKASVGGIFGKTHPTTRPLVIGLSEPDTTFTYALKIADKHARCASEEDNLSCDITDLDLDQGVEYSITLERSFGGKASESVGSGMITTLKPLQLQQSSLTSGQVVYDTPKEYTFSYDKSLSKDEVKLELIRNDTVEKVAIKTELRDKQLAVIPTGELPRETPFTLTIQYLEAIDGSVIGDPYQVNFSTSGGPKVAGVSIGSSSAPTAGAFTMTFDQNIADSANAAKLITLQGVSATVAISGNRATIQYSAELCQAFTVTIKMGIKNEHGIAQDEDWVFSSRTRCYTTSTIGASKNGRAIVAYSFGSGARTILFTGAMHGNERNTKGLLDSWISELEAKPQDIPAGTRVVVVPLVNPDGYAANTRTNANNVDLNRNFDTSDWKKDIQTVNGQPFGGGGGQSAMSEPETQVIANYTRQLSPALTLSYHSVAGYVIANTCGVSSQRASSYASSSGYRNMTGVSGAFSYEITGTYDDWMCERHGLPSILIELASSSSTELSRNRAAMWLMVRS